MPPAPPDETPDPPPFAAFPVERSERIYDSPWCGLRRDLLRLPDGGLQEYHVVEITDAVSVVPVLPDGRLVLLWQFRHPHGGSHWEVPAGRIHAGESPAAAAARELHEEAGLHAAQLRPLPGFYPINGISDHYCHAFVALGCTDAGGVRHEPTERIRTAVLARPAVERLLRGGRIQDGFSALTLSYYLAGMGAGP